jgi:uracil-DNA glycosylase
VGHGLQAAHAIADIAGDIVKCSRCPRLVAWREQVARDKVARFAGEPYWGRPVPGFGDPVARLALVGLAPAAHGGNRTGRVFTGDRSGDFLFAALHRAGYANQPTARSVTDGLVLTDCYVTAVNRCAPPANRPTPWERDACLPFLEREVAALSRLRVIVALGGYAWDGVLRAAAHLGWVSRQAGTPRFAHAASTPLGSVRLLGSFHPSQQNTFTGRLTPAMLDDLLGRAHELVEGAEA